MEEKKKTNEEILTFALNEDFVKQSLSKSLKRLVLMIQIRKRCDKKSAIEEVNEFVDGIINEEER
jgi:hypothetical protein